jgi:hypothetical protein
MAFMDASFAAKDGHRACLRDLRRGTEELRALANHNLLQTLAGREEQDALRFGRLRASQEKRSSKPGRQ